ncbi:MAG TPA: bifunctional UDP-N-acetylglucosamine diphosphorylase/glucosamine-1-phosphate N-acetyltransferase GlmU [Thermoleophilaceae bacterium]|nr:bifunctional UDP-N-acetylglucosamine diphosphorylase/glucosamine-1-phosphate N-acetyltransferase GlmU [Thermoleophilaceae bacterium]
MARDLTVLIMAAGHGTRMRSQVAKVLHPVCGRPMVLWVAEAARAAGAERVVCITRPGEGVAERLDGQVEVAEQTDGEGTGSAVLAARSAIEESEAVVVLSGDHPLIAQETIAGMIATHRASDAAATVLTTEAIEPTGYGRVLRAPDGSVERIVETKHTEGLEERVLSTREVNMGSYVFAADELLTALGEVGLDEGERYLTNVVPVLIERGRRVVPHTTGDVLSARGVNTRVDLMEVEQLARRRLLEQHALNGVTFASPHTTLVDADVEIGEDTVVGPGVSLHGATRIGARCEVGPHVTATDAVLGDEVTVSHAVMTECRVGHGATIGPFAYLRPGADIGPGAKVGTSVEIKNSTIGAGAKVPHLSYIGDADVGEGSNLGASSITANYDGKRKHRTTIGKGVKTGIHTSLVAPVTVGDEAYTGAGAVIREDVPDGSLAVSSPQQRNIERHSEANKDEKAE